MFWYVIVGFLASVGMLTLLWLLAGFFLPGSGAGKVALHCPAGKEYVLLRRYRWLREMGWVRFEVIILDSLLPQEAQTALVQRFPGVFFDTLEHWQTEKEQGRNGNG